MLVCETALNGFAIQKWPNDGLDNIKFSSVQRKKWAKMVIYIIIIEKLRKKILSICHLQFSSLYIYTYKLVKIIIDITLTNSSNLSDFWKSTKNTLKNLLWIIIAEIMLARASTPT